MTKLDEILKSPGIPNETKKMIDSLDSMGREALNAYYDENSDFRQHAQPETIAERFYADTKKIAELYHYTTYDSLKKIVSSQKFFLSSLHFMNDPQEMSYTFQLLENELSQLNAPQAMLKELKLIKDRVPWDVYVWSFSENDHSQSLLNYGDVAMGFKNQNVMNKLATHFSKGAKTLDDFTIGNAYSFPLKVEYNEQKQLEHIKPIARTWFSGYKNYHKDPYDMGELISACYKAIVFCSLCFKNPYLRQEEEIRYVVLKLKDGLDPDPEFYIGERPFVSCELTPDILEKIILSKKLNSKLEDTKLFLEDKGFTMTNVESTKLPY